jgi:hypothetical protein
VNYFALSFEFGMALAVTCVVPGLAQDKVIRLSETAETKSATVRLSDVLPVEAPAALRKAGNGIELGRAPQPGSARVFESRQIIACLSQAPEILRRISVPSSVTVRRTGWPISGEAVRTLTAEFLRRRGIQGESAGSALAWPSGLTTAQENPALQIVGEKWGSGSLQLRLRCVEREACGSFLVRASLPQLDEASGKRTTRSSGGSSADLVPRIAPSLNKSRNLAEAGGRATLIMDSGAVHISLPVVCLQRGALHEQIRVRDAGSSRIFSGEVLGLGVLRAVF